MRISSIWDRIRKLCKVTDETWNVPTINDLATQIPYNRYEDVCEYHFTKLIDILDEKYFSALHTMRRIVIFDEPDFWLKQEPSVYRFFSDLNELSPLKMFKKEIYGWY